MAYIYNLGQKFHSIARRYPEKPAIHSYDGGSVSFSKLDSLSNRIARFLLNHDLKKEDVVGIFNNKSINAFASMLACLKTGMIYTNLDITSPAERLKKMLNTCKPSVLLNDFDNLLDLGTNEYKIINLDNSFSEKLESYQDESLPITEEISGSDPAYIMFTSGSTGFPKGATMTHGNVLNFIKWGIQEYKVNDEDIFTNINPVYFDNSVFDFYVSLFSGATLTPFPTDLLKFPDKIVGFVNEFKPTIWFSVPSMLVYLLTTKSLTRKDFTSLRVITFGGEGFPKAKLRKLFELYGDRIRLVNVYGPTECTCICSAYDISEKDFEDMYSLAPLGYMAPNFKYEILPVGENIEQGELGLMGPQVGLGYFNDPDRTNQSFVQNPYNEKYMERMYLTGDLVRKDDLGQLHFLGRKDNQIKHMGYRIELEEIEAALNILPYVQETGVIYRKINDGLGYIHAFVHTNHKKEEVEIREDLKRILPSYMIPKKIGLLDALPKNKNGKIDRIALSKIE